MDNPYASPSSNLQGHDTYGSSAGISQRVAEIMRATKPWVRLVSITGWIAIVINLIEALQLGARGVGGAVIPMIIMASLAAKLWQYSSRIDVLLETGRASDLQSALAEHRKYWKTIGVLAILVMVIFFITFLAGIGSAISR